MPNDLTPTAEDMARDLAFELAAYEGLMAACRVGAFIEGGLETGGILLAAFPAAVRRALAAEAEVERLRKALAAQRDDIISLALERCLDHDGAGTVVDPGWAGFIKAVRAKRHNDG